MRRNRALLIDLPKLNPNHPEDLQCYLLLAITERLEEIADEIKLLRTQPGR